MGFANLAHMGAYQYMPSCFGKLSLSFKKKNVVFVAQNVVTLVSGPIDTNQAMEGGHGGKIRT